MKTLKTLFGGFARRRNEAGSQSAQSTRVVDASAGPPLQPPFDVATARLEAEQAGLTDAGMYDRWSFTPDVLPSYVRRIAGRIEQLTSSTRREELDDLELQHEFIGLASAERTSALGSLSSAQSAKELADELKEHIRRVLRGLVPELTTWAAPERLDEPVRRTRALLVGVPLVGLLIDGAWAYYALEVLGESTAATLGMALVFGWAGVLVAHLAGVLVRQSRAGGRRSRLALLAVCALLLAWMALFLADVRLGYLSAPVLVSGHAFASGISQYHLSSTLVFLGWLAVNLALWVGVGILAYEHHNPYVRAHQRAVASTEAADAACVEKEASLSAADHALMDAIARWEHVPAKWHAYRQELHHLSGELTEIWKRALAGAVADPELTTAVEHSVAIVTAEERAGRQKEGEPQQPSGRDLWSAEENSTDDEEQAA